MFLHYTGDISKNHQGGIKGRKLKPKVILHHENGSNPDRCFVLLFKLYNSLCPAGSFFLKPLTKPTEKCWYTNKPIGRNTLEGTVARLCRKAESLGCKTNHSLRATAATRLYNAGVDEQLVVERTGHRSSIVQKNI